MTYVRTWRLHNRVPNVPHTCSHADLVKSCVDPANSIEQSTVTCSWQLAQAVTFSSSAVAKQGSLGVDASHMETTTRFLLAHLPVSGLMALM